MYSMEDDRERQLFDQEERMFEEGELSERNKRKLASVGEEFQEDLQKLIIKHVRSLVDVYVGYEPISSSRFHKLCGEFYSRSCQEVLKHLYDKPF